MIAGDDTAAWVGAGGAFLGGFGAAVAAYFAYRSAKESARVGEHAILIERLGRYERVRSTLAGLRTAGGNAWPQGLVELRMALRSSDPLPASQRIADPSTSGGRTEELGSAIVEVEAAIKATEERLRS